MKSKYNWNSAIRASAEGEYPAAYSGNLASKIIKNQPSDLEVNVISNADYSSRLEFDLKRPFMKMAIEENQNKITAIVNRMLCKSHSQL